MSIGVATSITPRTRCGGNNAVAKTTKGLAALASANPSSFMVAGSRFDLWKRTLRFEFLVSY